MKKLFSLVLLLALTVTCQGQSPGFKRSGTNLPFVLNIESNHVINIDRGSGLAPANLPLGALRELYRTNYDAKFANAIDPAPVNPQQLKRLKAKIYAGEKITTAYLGDSVGKDVQSAIEYALLPFMGRAGAVGASVPDLQGNYFYNTASGTRTDYASGANGIFWGAFSCLGNGAVLTIASTVSNGITGDSIGLAWYQSSGFGSLLIETQQVSGAWGTLRTVSGSGGAGLTMATTNITVPLTNYYMRITSTGTNIPVGMAIRDTRTARGFIASSTTSPGSSALTFAQNAGSNNVATYLQWQNPDVIFYNAERIDTATNEVPWFDTLLSNAVPNCDLVLIAYHQNTDAAQSYQNREFMLAHAKRYGRAFFDSFGESQPYSNSVANGLYNADKVHLVNTGRAVLYSRVASQLGLGVDSMLALGLSLPTAATDATKANLAGGNAFTGNQTITGNANVTGTFGVGSFMAVSNGITFYGPNADLALRDKNNNSIQTLINYKAQTYHFQESTSSYKDMFSISNALGVPTFSFDPTGYGAPNIGRPAAPWGKAIFQTYVISSNALSAWPTAPQKAGDAIMVNSNGVVFMLTSGIGTTWTATNKIAP